MDPEEKGRRAEERGFEALEKLKATYPLVLKARRSSPSVDARGIDALVVISLPKGSRKPEMTVPVEFKSSPAGVAKWKVVHSDLHRAGVLIFHFPEDMTQRQIRSLVYRALERVQHNSRNGTLYHSMFQRLFVGGSRNLYRNIMRIKRRREREKSG